MARVFVSHASEDLTTAAEAREWLRAEGHEVFLRGSVRKARMSPIWLVTTASTDDIARVWDIATGEATATLVGHTAAVTCCSFSPRGLLLATTSSDKTARLWELSYAT